MIAFNQRCCRHEARSYPYSYRLIFRRRAQQRWKRSRERRTYSLLFSIWSSFRYKGRKALTWRLLECGPWKGMVAVTRGGLAPAAIVAARSTSGLSKPCCVIGYGPDDYNPQQANETTVIKPPAVVGDGGGWLVVDDFVNTGRTAKVLRKLMPKAHFAYLREAPRPGAGRYLGPVHKLSDRLLIELDIGFTTRFDTVCCGDDRYRTHQRAVFCGVALSG